MALHKQFVFNGGDSDQNDLSYTPGADKTGQDSDGKMVASMSGYGVANQVYDKVSGKMVTSYEVLEAYPGWVMRGDTGDNGQTYVENIVHNIGTNNNLGRLDRVTNNGDGTYTLHCDSELNSNGHPQTEPKAGDYFIIHSTLLEGYFAKDGYDSEYNDSDSTNISYVVHPTSAHGQTNGWKDWVNGDHTTSGSQADLYLRTNDHKLARGQTVGSMPKLADVPDAFDDFS